MDCLFPLSLVSPEPHRAMFRKDLRGRLPIVSRCQFQGAIAASIKRIDIRSLRNREPDGILVAFRGSAMQCGPVIRPIFRIDLTIL